MTEEVQTADRRTPFQRFEDLTRRLVSVPKAELDKQLKKAKRNGARRRAA
jgi:hypothetical protein